MSLAHQSSQGMLVFSIDLAPRGGNLLSVTRELLGMFRGRNIAATWAGGDPVRCPAVRLVREAGQGHEIAVLGSTTWIGSAAGRARFASELAQRTVAAQAAGTPVSTLVPGDATLDDHLDLLVKHGFTAVRGLIDEAGRARVAAQPHALHFGLWEFPVSLRLPAVGRWPIASGGALRTRRSIDRAVFANHLFHLSIDAGRLADAGTGARRIVGRALDHARRRAEEHAIEIVTLAEAAMRLSQPRLAAPTRSILRPAG